MTQPAKKTKKPVAPPKSGTGSSTAGSPLVIVESPNKVKTISAILGGDYTVRASYGHVADIPDTDGAVDIANGFSVHYSPTKKGAEILAGLRRDLESASELILATDDDREGEMIAHLLWEFLQPTVPVSRITFHAITESEVRNALAHRRDIAAGMVEAARTRRVLDHLYGFKVSPVLWSKVRGGLGAGRVQSPALRLVVEREDERRRFVAVGYCGIEAVLLTTPAVTAGLRSVDGVRIAASKDIDATGVVAGDARLLPRDEAESLAAAMEGSDMTVVGVKTERYTRRPRRPYVTSDLLSDIVNRLNVGPGVAQSLMNQLHEKGLISYPRTDSPALSPGVIVAARKIAVEMFGEDSVPAKPNYFGPAKKSAQQAHEAIRPANPSLRSPAGLTPQLRTVYDMVWRRTVASQMVDATGTTVSVTFEVPAGDHGTCTFTASGTTIENPGHRQVYSSPEDDEPTPLAAFTTGDTVGVASMEVNDHATRPPARYTAATLIKALEELEIGRPSTYASAIESLRREYLWSKRGDRALIPTITGIAVTRFLAQRFPKLIDDTFTREMEDRLERIVEGGAGYEEVLSTFFLEGDDTWPALADMIEATMRDHDPGEHPVEVLGAHPVTGEEIVLKAGKMFSRRRKGSKRGSGSPYLKCGDRNVALNDQSEFALLTLARAVSMIDVPAEGRALGTWEDGTVLLKVGPYGPYVTDGMTSASLPETVDLDTVDLAQATVALARRRDRAGKG